MKSRFNQARAPNLSFFRDSYANEIDLLHNAGRERIGIEIKSSATYHRAFKKSLLRFRKTVAPLARSFIIYYGAAKSFSDGIEALPFARTHRLFEKASVQSKEAGLAASR